MSTQTTTQINAQSSTQTTIKLHHAHLTKGLPTHELAARRRRTPPARPLVPRATTRHVAPLGRSGADDQGQALERLTLHRADKAAVKFDSGQQLIFSRQEPLRQLWLAARSGGFHFDYNEEDNNWQCDTSDELLSEMLARLVQEQAGAELDFDEI